MRSFWDRRARERALFYVDNRLDYRDPDADRFWSGGAEDLTRLLDALDLAIAPGDVVVEIGCGVGRLTRGLAERAAHVTAIDVSPEMIQRAVESNPGLRNVTWLVGDGETLAGVGDAVADACVSHVTFQHVPDPAITLGYVREMGRVLKPGGWAGFQISNDPAVHVAPPGGFGAWLRRLLGRAPRGQADPAWLGSAVDLGDLSATAAAAGLAVERVVNEGTQFCLVRLRRATT
jgi:SAM-dependent methyltransferase